MTVQRTLLQGYTRDYERATESLQAFVSALPDGPISQACRDRFCELFEEMRSAQTAWRAAVLDPGVTAQEIRTGEG